MRMLADELTQQDPTESIPPQQRKIAFYLMILLVAGIYFFYLAQ